MHMPYSNSVDLGKNRFLIYPKEKNLGNIRQ